MSCTTLMQKIYKTCKIRLLFTIPDVKTHQPRTFTVINDNGSDVEYRALYRKYAGLHFDKSAVERRFFLKYINGRGTNQVVGINTFGRLASMIARYLNLKVLHLFMGHCFRRSSATLLTNAGADLLRLKKNMVGWKSAHNS
ncbi:hypothetical protein ILUMI_09134 [Ignelater luminosus]|uniref:Integrase n=1 Tax=Ignelater luminosus TaxID=2038154 RepID=A0A8K0D9V7_IGNLU|nr:hypothetical protein ILUMI_09134 [Ignelater luminosus]